MEAFIRFLIQHNEKIVYISGGVICFLSAVVVWFQVFGKKGDSSVQKAQVDLTGVEEMLQKILSQAQGAIQSTGQSTSAAIASGEANADAEALKRELETRAKMITDLQAQIASAKSNNDSAELLAKIKNLEGKLAEYEIIEDDIADLSNFKEENARLQKELEALKRGGPQLVDQFADALNAKPDPAAPVMETAAAPTSVQAQKSDSLADAVAQAQDKIDSAVVPAAAVAPTAAPAADTKPAQEAKTDIFGEFSGDATAEEADPLSALGDIDPDKMLDELKDLNSDLNLGADALDEAPDIEKMAQEAEGLEKKG